MDVGGTDVKLAVSADGDLVLCKEFDWFPAAFARGEELTGPLLLLTRLMRAAGSLCQAGRGAEVVHSALERRATLTEMERAAETMERAAGGDLRSFNAIGLSFPDVVIQNRIVGGETPKTQGMRNNPLLDYEEQFAKITGLNADLAAYTVPGGPVRCVNDGPMAAFTAAVEQAAGGADLSQGFFAHSLGTDLGTGWVLPDGSIPDLPLEVYNFILDLGSRDQRDRFDPEDVRSNRPGRCKSTPASGGCSGWPPTACPGRTRRCFRRRWTGGCSGGRGTGSLSPQSRRICASPVWSFLWSRPPGVRGRRSCSGKSANIWPSPPRS